MKLVGPIVVVLALAVSMTGAGAAPGATYVDHDKVTAALAKGGVLAKGTNLTVSIFYRPKGSDVPEIHAKRTHVWYVLDGSATMVSGGSLIGGKVVEPGLTHGTDIENGQTRQLTKGDVVVVPPGTPHWWKEVPNSITLYSVNTE